MSFGKTIRLFAGDGRPRRATRLPFQLRPPPDHQSQCHSIKNIRPGADITWQPQQMALRWDSWLYIDEFENFITPSMAEILKVARK